MKNEKIIYFRETYENFLKFVAHLIFFSITKNKNI